MNASGQIRTLGPLRSVAVFAKGGLEDDPWFATVCSAVEQMCDRMQLVPRRSDDEDRAIVAAADLVLVLGGDGTFLSAARLAAPAGIPVIGINLGSLGFLAEYERDEWERALSDIRSGTLNIESRAMLECERDGNAIGCALNDVVINKSALARMIQLHVEIDGRHVSSMRADGLIVSTPVGSTAYNLSAGGPIVQPGTDVIVMTPICPHQLNIRPLVVAPAADIRIRVGDPGDDCYLTLDGQIGVEIASGSNILIRRAPYSLPLVGARGRRFYEILMRKLGWGEPNGQR